MIIDTHVHVSPGSQESDRSEPSQVRRRLELNGISAAIVSPALDYSTPHGVGSSRRQNDFIASLIQTDPSTFPTGFGVVEPRHGTPALDEVDRVLGELQLAGLAFHNNIAGMPIDHPSMIAILERVEKYPHAVVQLRTAPYSVLEAVYRFARVVEMFPTVTFLNSRPFLDTTHEVGSLWIGSRFSNVYFDTASMRTQLYTIDRVVDAIGAERVLFGSGIPYATKSLDLELIARSNLDDEQRHAVLEGNARRLFRLG